MWRNTDESYGWVTILFHWAIAILFLCQIPLGYLTQATENRPALQFELYQWHKSIGFLVLALAVPRLIWVLLTVKPRPLPKTTRLEAIAARTAHLVLLLLTVLVPLAGWAVASASPLRIPSYVFNLVVIPPLPFTPSERQEIFWSNVHAVLAYGGGMIALVHILAALRHHILLRDATLIRMLRPHRD
ncbi:cytochrome B [Paramesorhizobium deserti]|uniref:Cytochrome B n=1 Tax=Paramesorhizobium deserti TaxID=1494590 RepID=A0A135HTX8_9HYPH|nr:cytochrome b [Paramesorhizobium deserti]KXF76647.1 cytochrome B [Paramesorhizobium deserti]